MIPPLCVNHDQQGSGRKLPNFRARAAFVQWPMQIILFAFAPLFTFVSAKLSRPGSARQAREDFKKSLRFIGVPEL